MVRRKERQAKLVRVTAMGEDSEDKYGNDQQLWTEKFKMSERKEKNMEEEM